MLTRSDLPRPVHCGRLMPGVALALALGLFMGGAGSVRAHDHINAGAQGSESGRALYFVNGDRFVADSGYVVGMEAVASGEKAGLYRGAITFTALAATPDYGGPAFDHAALGAHIELRVESVEGPAGGNFGFWEAQEGEEGTELTWQLPVGTRDGAVTFVVSETPGEAGDDPYGHIHGRVFTATLPGLYQVGVRLVDRSTHGLNGGPLHPPSELQFIAFQAGVSIARLERVEGGVQIHFAALAEHRYQVERALSVGPGAVWETVGDPTTGRNHMERVTVPMTSASAFFRLRRVAL